MSRRATYDRVCGVQEVARRFDVTRAAVIQMARKGQIPGRQLWNPTGNKGPWVFDRDQIERIARRRERA